MLKFRVILMLLVTSLFLMTNAANSYAFWGTKELDTEKSAVKLSREVTRGGYDIVSTEELKKVD